MIWMQFSLFVASLVVLSSCKVMENIKLISHECLHNKAIAADYEPLGSEIIIGNLTVYEYEAPDNANKNRMLIGAYDAFGFGYDNIKQVVDQLAVQNGGFKAILPDFFRGEILNPDSSSDEILEWLTTVGNWDSVVKPDLINLIRHYQNEGVEHFAIFGFCWGGKVATLAAIELSEYFKASGLIHPSLVENSEAVDVKIPMYLMPSQDEPDMEPFYEVLQNKFGDNSGHRRFTDMMHGFAGARGNFSDPLIQTRVNEVITTLGAFFDRNLLNNSISIQPNYLLVMALLISFFVVSQS